MTRFTRLQRIVLHEIATSDERADRIAHRVGSTTSSVRVFAHQLRAATGTRTLPGLVTWYLASMPRDERDALLERLHPHAREHRARLEPVSTIESPKNPANTRDFE